MAHFAQVIDGIVTQIIVADQEFIDSGAVGNPAEWVQTSYNTYGGAHKEGGTPLRGNYAGIGFTYDAVNDVFVAPTPYPSWVLSQTTWLWEAPVPMPVDGKVYGWDEPSLSWIEFAAI